MLGASLKGDHARAVEFLYPPAVEIFGGREKLIAAMRKQTKENEDAGGKLHSVTAERAMQVVSEGGTMYAVVPTKIGWTLQGRDMSSTSFMLGLSSDEGKTWKFLEGDRKSVV